jgi:hypothetical protein
MRQRTKWLTGLSALLIVTAGTGAFHYWRNRDRGSARELLGLMPAEARAVVYADLDALRKSPFLAELLALTPTPGTDPEYAEFVKETGFDYARDLDRVALALLPQGKEQTVLAVAEGRLDRQKITHYALKSGKRIELGGREFITTSVSGSPKRISFLFLGPNLVILTNATDLGALAAHLTPQKDNPANTPWRERFARLGGSPVFAVTPIRAAEAVGLATQTAGGLRSDDLAMLAGSLRWGTLALRPEGNALRVVAEAECTDEESARKLSGVASGFTMLAGAELAALKTQRHLDAETFAALQEMLKSVDVSRIDRGETKAVRIVLVVTPRVLEAVKKLGLDEAH